MLKKKHYISPIFINYRDEYKNDLAALTREWLEKYFTVGSEDLKFMSDPKGYILDKGGFIFLAKVDGKTIGTVSLIRATNQELELAKLSVTERYQGYGFGKRLIHFALQKSIEAGADQVILYTSSELKTAFQLYQKLGFRLQPDDSSKYKDADLKMVLKLSDYQKQTIN